ncbi:MAG TPA: neutral/alkaline non-lysosomal ceramidase N-terminal domain-containing protein [Planctomycetota bacterium]|nr:neutral/alkaline non-lysosomal ceramidase N-terminal domain-containing protein [Planctomycetota bacterium]
MRILIGLALLGLLGCASTSSDDPAPTLRAGASKVKITPDHPGWMTGYGNRNHIADGVKTDLWVRALVLEGPAGKRLVLVTADLLGFPPKLSQSIRKEAVDRFGLDPADLMLVASHTHGGPAIPERPSMEIFHGLDEKTGQDVYEYADWLEDRVLEAISKAMVARKPATAMLTHAEAHFGMNRRFRNPSGSYAIKDNPEGLVDPDVLIVRVASDLGTPVATVYTYACHGTTLGGDIYQYHGDWIGYASDEIEKASGGAPALFATGCGADLNPSPRGKFEMAEAHGHAMAAAVAGAPPGTPLAGPFTSVLSTIDLPLAPPPERELLQKLAAEEVPPGKVSYRKRHATEMLKLLDAGKLPRAVPLPIQVWRLGDEKVVAFGGETCVEYALRTKKELGAPHTWVIGYANMVPCYIPSEKVLSESGYEPGWEPGTKDTIATGSMMFYGWPVPFAPGIEARIMAEVERLAKD